MQREIEGATQTRAAERRPTLDELAQRLDAICAKQPFETGWYLKDLRTGRAADRRGAVIVPSASTRKIAIMMSALRDVHAGRLTLEQPVKIDARYQISNSGCCQHFRPGFTLTLHDILILMIVVSDNACTGTIADMLGLDRVNEFCRSIGMVGTTHRQGIPPNSALQADAVPDLTRINVTTPADVGLLLDLIDQGTRDEQAAGRLGCTRELCRLALDILSWQLLNTRLPALLPADTKVAHKTGTAGRNFNDAGIIYEADRPLFILTVYTDGVPPELPDGMPGKAAASQHIARLCRTCWDALRSPATS